ncbi:MAG: hypothetical protein ABW250_20305 [Pyrinomonadaceae bacterium]
MSPFIVRYSTAPGDITPDGIAAFRSMAIKVIGVEGRKFLPETADALTQDFLLVNGKSLGSVMRARRQAYEEFSRYRHEINAEERVEPRSIDELPD